MILRTGIDIVEIKRLEVLIEKRGYCFLRRHFSENEIDYCRSKPRPAVHFAGRLAAKEAVYKALSLRWETGFSWKNIEICETEQGRPEVVLIEKIQVYFEKSGFQGIEISISHTKEYAAATALVWG